MISYPDELHPLLGKLTLGAIPLHEPILLGTFAAVALGGTAVLALLTKYRLWGMLWRDWLTSIDHKKIGIMYIVLGVVMLLRGFADAIMMRAHQAMAFGDNPGFLPPHHYDQIFTAHGVIMIFFVAMPFVTGFMNYVVPLQIGARDVAFPFLNNFSFWMTAGGAILIMISLFVGEFAKTGWLAYPPLSGILASPDVGVDYYLWALQIAGVGTTLSGINLIATIIKMRAPGMTLMKMPVFTWTSLCTNVLIVATSNRRHLLPEYHSDNQTYKHTADGELHPGEVVEEKISLSERFGLWVSFYPFSQDEYLAIVGQWLAHLGLNEAAIEHARPEALIWALRSWWSLVSSSQMAWRWASTSACETTPSATRRSSTWCAASSTTPMTSWCARTTDAASRSRSRSTPRTWGG